MQMAIIAVHTVKQKKTPPYKIAVGHFSWLQLFTPNTMLVVHQR